MRNEDYPSKWLVDINPPQNDVCNVTFDCLGTLLGEKFMLTLSTLITRQTAFASCRGSSAILHVCWLMFSNLFVGNLDWSFLIVTLPQIIMEPDSEVEDHVLSLSRDPLSGSLLVAGRVSPKR